MSSSLSPSEGARLVNGEKLAPTAVLHSVVSIGERNPRREDTSSGNRKYPRHRTPRQVEDRVELSEDARGEVEALAPSGQEAPTSQESIKPEMPLQTGFQAKV